ncbi:MAG: carph-isopro domain-containing protein [Allosphingosinicella sp.]|uniref:carph-isopro domain-containing protein n=1 Tax=Allosphingosinicella sp. TaxID=2823234 RepID=UPI00394712ED
MQRLTDDAMIALGGTTAVARLIHAPVSTVHSWKRNGIPASRLAHLKLAARDAGIEIDWAAAVEPVDAAPGVVASAGKEAEVSSAAAPSIGEAA